MQTKVLRNVFSNTIKMVRRQFSNNDDTCKIMFTKTHEYIKFGKNNIGTIGISSYASTNVGEIIFTELIPEGEAVEKDQVIGTLETVKSANDIYSSVNGIILEQNIKIFENPHIINDDPLGEGWLVKISCVDKSDPELMDSETYAEYVESEKSD
jgi:glycine cleavage system H protein